MKRSLYFLKGDVTFKPMGNDGLLIHISNVDDKSMVWNGRPWFVQGLNFVLLEWSSDLYPHDATITGVDQ